MKLFDQFVESIRADVGGGVQYRPDSDLWYQHLGYQTATGLRVSPESALRVAAVYACVRVIAETISSLPLIIYKSLPNGGRERATDHPAYKLLHDTPNEWQTSYEFWEMMQAHLELRGNAFARKVAGMDSAIEQLIPLHPDRVSVFRLPNGRLQYQVRYFYTAKVETYAQEEIFHLRGLSSDGLVGLSTIGVGAEAIGVGLAAQEFAARFFQNDSTPSGVLTHPKVLTDTSHERIKKSWREQNSGMNQHSIKVLEEGMTYANIGLTNKDSQLLEARQFSRGDIASLFRVPPHKIGDLSRATFSNIEQQNIEFATDAIRPRLVRTEKRIESDILEPFGLGPLYFCEFLMDALMRGDLKSRYEAYSTGINAGFLVRNEARAKENLNPIDGLDEPLAPLNLGPSDADDTPDPDAPGDTSDQAEPSDSTEEGAFRLPMSAPEQLARSFVQSAADRIVRREVKRLEFLESHANGNFGEMLIQFYSGFREVIANDMHLTEEAVSQYVDQNRLLLVEGRKEAIAAIEKDAPRRLAALALKEKIQ
jgi:HK97 family phage portal protein